MERSEETQKNWLKRFERKVAEGRIGKFISWFDFMKEKSEIKIEDFQQLAYPYGQSWLYPYGRIGNKVYTKRMNKKIELYLKFKNATKAKRFMEGVK